MEIDRNKLANLDEESLRSLIYQVCSAMGLPEERARRMAANAPILRGMLARAGERDMQKIVNAVGEEKAAEILSSVGKPKNGK